MQQSMCKFKNHDNVIQLLCLNPNCKTSRLACVMCEREFHKLHRDDLEILNSFIINIKEKSKDFQVSNQQQEFVNLINSLNQQQECLIKEFQVLIDNILEIISQLKNRVKILTEGFQQEMGFFEKLQNLTVDMLLQMTEEQLDQVIHIQQTYNDKSMISRLSRVKEECTNEIQQIQTSSIDELIQSLYKQLELQQQDSQIIKIVYYRYLVPKELQSLRKYIQIGMNICREEWQWWQEWLESKKKKKELEWEESYLSLQQQLEQDNYNQEIKQRIDQFIYENI